ncbi:MAG: hypothetical protein JRG95_01300, partial [Deltaproteobacteria bacterium]|nr:hypothetical protein [Deltaproteobacteria bacterium]
MQPTNVLIVVASDSGRTLRMAEALAEGAGEISETVTVTSAAEAQNEQLLAADAIVLGSGVHMAGMESSMRAHPDFTPGHPGRARALAGADAQPPRPLRNRRLPLGPPGRDESRHRSAWAHRDAAGLRPGAW